MTYANKMRGMHWPREGHGTEHSIFQSRNPAPQAAPEQVPPKQRPD